MTKLTKDAFENGCFHLHVKDGEVQNAFSHLTLPKGEYVLHMKVDAVYTADEFVDSHAKDAAEIRIEPKSRVYNLGAKTISALVMATVILFTVATQTAYAGSKPERFWWDNGGSYVEAHTCKAAMRDLHETVSFLAGHLHIGDKYTHPQRGYLTHDEAVTIRIWLQNYSSVSTRGMFSQANKVYKGKAHVNTCNNLRVKYELGMKWIPDLLKERSPYF